MTKCNIPEHLTDKALQKRKAELKESLAATKKLIDTLSNKMDCFEHDTVQYEGIMMTIREIYPRLHGIQNSLSHLNRLLGMSPAQRLEEENKNSM